MSSDHKFEISILKNLLSKLKRPFQIFGERFDKSPIETVLDLESFIQTRASYVSQTALYGYLKTRMGTKYRVLFEDEVFSGAIRVGAGKVFASSLSDLTVYCVSNIFGQGKLSVEEAKALAIHLYGAGLAKGLENLVPEERPEGCEARFEARALKEDWISGAKGRAAFAGSERDLIQSAPVSDQFKKLDGEIVGNSIRFRWNDIREQFQNRAVPAKIAEDWVAEHPAQTPAAA